MFFSCNTIFSYLLELPAGYDSVILVSPYGSARFGRQYAS
jgi:hypothetical protein